MAVIDELIESNNLQLDGEGNVKIIPLSKYEYQTFPIGENYVTITQDNYIGLKCRVYQFSDDLTSVELFNAEQFQTFLRNRVRNVNSL